MAIGKNKIDVTIDEACYSPNDCAMAVIAKMTAQGRDCSLVAKGASPIIMLNGSKYFVQMGPKLQGDQQMVYLNHY